VASSTTVDFGRDLSCTTSILTTRYSTGPRLVAEAIFRRFITPRGSLQGGEDEQNYGLDLANLIGSVSTPSAVASLPGQIEAECIKDERVISATATVTSTTSGPSTAWNIQINGKTGAGPFALVIGVSGVTASLLGIS
jgi:hypothetical protein